MSRLETRVHSLSAGEPSGPQPPTSQTNAGQATGTQTLERGLHVIEAVSQGHRDLDRLVRATGLSRSTVHRLGQALVRWRYLRFTPQSGYALGPKLLELGFQYHQGLHLPSVSRPHLERLAEQTGDTVHLGVLEGAEIIYLDKVSGVRGVETTSRIGARKSAHTTGLGKVLLALLGEQPGTPGSIRAQGYAFDLEENEVGIHCVACPVFDGSGRGVAAISVTSAAQFLPLPRMNEVLPLVLEASAAISRELGWSGYA